MPASAAHAITMPQTWVAVGSVHRQARCTCNWVGPRRVIFHCAAAVDALIHAAQNGCMPATPLQRATLSRPRAVRAV